MHSILSRLFLLCSITLLLGIELVPQPIAANSSVSQAADNSNSVFLPLVIGPEQQPSAQELIAQALSQGQIDYETSLLYRTYALFGDRRLPYELYGSGSEGEDSGLFVELEEAPISEELRTKLHPFLVRPDHPESVYSTAPRPATAQHLRPNSTLFCDSKNWTAIASTTVKVKVHAMCGDFDYEAAIRQALGEIEALWGPMTQLMGEPILDAGGPDGGYSDDIDLYLMEPAGKLVREGYPYRIEGFAMAQAINAPPRANDKSSGFMMLNRSDLNNPNFTSTLAHEFFHVLQSAYNYNVKFRGDQEWWFTEASAVWAESHFVRETTAQEVHTRFTGNFQTEDLPLHISADDASANRKARLHMYAAYIWPFFMEQERSPQAVAQVWKSLAGIGDDWDKAMEIMNAQLPFKENFHRFAVRNLNQALTPGDPIQPRYKALDPNFPDGVLPRMEANIYLYGSSSDEPSFTLEEQLPALRAHYYHITPDASSSKLSFELTDFDLEALDLDLVVKRRGAGWELRSATTGERLTWCDVEEAYVVISNHTLDLEERIPATIDIYSEPNCGAAITGTIQYVENGEAFDGSDKLSNTLTINVRMRYDPATDDYIDDGSTFSASGTRNIVIRGTGDVIVQTSDISYSGSGGFDADELINVDYVGGHNEIFFDASMYVDNQATTTLYVDGTSYTYTSSGTERWEYGCGDANGGVLGQRSSETSNTFGIDCLATLNNSRQNYSLKVTGTLNVAEQQTP